MDSATSEAGIPDYPECYTDTAQFPYSPAVQSPENPNFEWGLSGNIALQNPPYTVTDTGLRRGQFGNTLFKSPTGTQNLPSIGRSVIPVNPMLGYQAPHDSAPPATMDSYNANQTSQNQTQFASTNTASYNRAGAGNASHKSHNSNTVIISENELAKGKLPIVHAKFAVLTPVRVQSAQ
jgi:hypothetical protein